jgi:alanine dehydrogenase
MGNLLEMLQQEIPIERSQAIMNTPQTIGFPRMKKESGEKRVFLPEFIQYLTTLGVIVYLEEGYGSRSGYTFDDYRQGNEEVLMCSRDEAFQQDVVIVLRSPLREEFSMLKRGGCLVSMLHYPTRPVRVNILKDLEIKAISLDSIVNGQNIRLVENMKAVAWNGLEAAFDILEKRWPGLVRPDQEPINVLILGTGMVGKHAVDAATKLGNIERNNQHIQNGGPGVLALAVGRNVTNNPTMMEKLFRQSDILVDASQRRDPTKPLVPNEWIGWLPEHAVIADLAVDPYTSDAVPPVVRGIEGIPQGNLDQYIFMPDDPLWDKTVPKEIPSQNRRAVTTCYSWPGIHPEACMYHYALQMEPLIKVLIAKGYDNLSLDGDYFERALYRATLKAWLHTSHPTLKMRL